MKFIQGQNRTQINLFPVSLDQSIEPDNEMGITDLFVDSLSTKDFGFRMDFIENCRQAYHPSDLLKLFITIEKEHLYKRRQAMEEHPYGTLKRQWGFCYILTKKRKDRASPDAGMMFIAYNLRRIGNILTREVLKEYLRILISSFLRIFDLSGLCLMISEGHFPAEQQLLSENSRWLRLV